MVRLGKIFNNNFVVGNKADLEITLDYTYKSQPQKKMVVHEIEVVSRTLS